MHWNPKKDIPKPGIQLAPPGRHDFGGMYCQSEHVCLELVPQNGNVVLGI